MEIDENANAIAETMTPKEQALAAYDLTLEKLDSTLRKSIRKPPADPRPLDKGGASIMRLRLLPKERAPQLFWSSAWCFYEIGVGNYPIDRANFGAVQFVMFPENKQCGSGRFRPGVEGITRGLQPDGRKGFFLDLRGGVNGAAILCGFRYCLGEFSAFYPETAAENLAWLIKGTLRAFAALG